MKKENQKETYLGRERWFKPLSEALSPFPLPFICHALRLWTHRGGGDGGGKAGGVIYITFVHHTVNCVERVVVVIYYHL